LETHQLGCFLDAPGAEAVWLNGNGRPTMTILDALEQNLGKRHFCQFHIRSPGQRFCGQGRPLALRPSRNVALFGIKQAIELGAAGLHELGDLVLCERLGLHRRFDLQGDDFLDRSGVEFFQNGLLFEEPGTPIGVAVTRARANGHVFDRCPRCRAATNANAAALTARARKASFD
jgi:hypothetical protein